MNDLPQIRTTATVTKLDKTFKGDVLVSGSHGGVYAAHLAALANIRGVILNDAGGGKDGAGYASLNYLDKFGIPAATVSHSSARIGDGEDMLKRGSISHVNNSASFLGCKINQSSCDCANFMLCARMLPNRIPPYEESRFLFSDQHQTPKIWGIDSASLIRHEDTNQIVLTASHGGLLSNEKSSAIAVDVAACAFNDAGVGREGAGISRLSALDERRIPAVTVDCMSARIGDIRSACETGIISYANKSADALGTIPGNSLREFAKNIRHLLNQH